MSLSALDLICQIQKLRESTSSLRLHPEDEAYLYAATLALVCDRNRLDLDKQVEFIEKMKDLFSLCLGELTRELEIFRRKPAYIPQLKEPVLELREDWTQSSHTNGHAEEELIA